MALIDRFWESMDFKSIDRNQKSIKFSYSNIRWTRTRVFCCIIYC